MRGARAGHGACVGPTSGPRFAPVGLIVCVCATLGLWASASGPAGLARFPPLGLRLWASGHSLCFGSGPGGQT
eukprot:996596-Alexandrium_andersonii.AAC.1